MLSDLFFSVVGGVFVLALQFVFFPAVRDRVISYFRSDTLIHGKWDWYENTRHEKIGSLDLTQKGSLIRGVLSRTVAKDGSGATRTFTVRGEIYHDSVVLNFFEDSDRRRRGTMSLLVGQVKEVMYGRNVYIAVGSNKPISDLYVFIKPDFKDIEVPRIRHEIENLDMANSPALISHTP
ncbi:MAG: hypothetical protein RSE12_17290 [Fuscovulum sp.]|nr:MAG: hypothetical protein RSE12_17290 [Fuscovulum sp.]